MQEHQLGVGEKPGYGRSSRIKSVDGLRALAFMLVFLFHSWEYAGRPRISLVTDVIGQNTRPDLFVVLTGFVLYLPFAVDHDRHVRFRSAKYLERRIKRIVLPYYAALLLAIALPFVLKRFYAAVGNDPERASLPATADIVTHLSFTHMLFPEYWAGINGSLWTMSLEMQLYVLFPVVILAIARWGLLALLPMAIVSVAWHLASPFQGSFPEDFLWGATAIGRLTEFMAGMVAAVIVIRHAHRLTALSLVGFGVTFVGGYVAGTSELARSSLPIREVGLSVAFGALVVLAIGLRPVERVFGSSLVSRLGYMAYSMFLVHQPLIYYFSEGVERVVGVPEGHLELAILWTAGLGFVLGVGWVFFRLIEEPCIRWSKNARVVPAKGN